VSTLARLVLAAALASACDGTSPAPADAPPTDIAVPAPVAAPSARVQTHDEWIDLVHQRPSAVVQREGRMIVELGTEAAYKHVALGHRSSWRLGEDIDGRRTGVVIGRSAALDLPLDGALAPALHPDVDGHPGLAMAITLQALVPQQVVTVSIGERVLAHVSLTSGWERRTFSLPADAIRHGDNRLRMHFRRTPTDPAILGPAAVARVEVGTHADITGSVAIPETPAFTVIDRGEGSPGLELAPGTGLAFYVEPPRRARLELDVSGRGVFEVLVSTSDDHRAGRPPTIASQEPLRETGHHRSVDLGAWGGIPIRVELRARSDRDALARARIDTAHVAVKRVQPLDRRERKSRDVIILAIEGARADEVELGGRPPLPELEALLGESLVFERAYAVAPAAVPSHAAWLSSVAPPVHLTVRGTFVADGQTLLPETLERLGHYRAIVSANADISADRGLAQGIDDLRHVRDEGPDEHARRTVEIAAERFTGRAGKWFMVIDVTDPQAPYEPPRELLGELTAPPRAPLAHLTHVWVGRVRLGKLVPDAREIAYVRRLYRGELQMVSTATGELIELLRRERRLDDAIIVMLGVHGEEFAEHGGAGHGITLYEESLRVPLAIRAPDLLGTGRIVAPVDLLDLAPTITDLLGIPAPQAWQGESLVGIIDDPSPPPRLIVAYRGDGSRAGIVGNAKLWLGPGTAERFFDLEHDPGETTDAVADGGVALRIVRTALAWELAYAERWRRGRWGTGANLLPAFALDHGM
jgi:arylsulfatase A-like enzyme